jgi:hypothetical protein
MWDIGGCRVPSSPDATYFEQFGGAWNRDHRQRDFSRSAGAYAPTRRASGPPHLWPDADCVAESGADGSTALPANLPAAVTPDQVQLEASNEPWVMTHGEPHAGDALFLIRRGRVHLIGWDATCIAPRERDLRILRYGDQPSALARGNRDVVAAYQGTAGLLNLKCSCSNCFRSE